MIEKAVELSNIKQGMIITQDIYSRDNNLIAKKNSVVTTKILNRLRFSSVSTISVLIDEKTGSPTLDKSSSGGNSPIEDAIKTPQKLNETQKTREFQIFDAAHDKLTNDFDLMANSLIKTSNPVDNNQLLSMLDCVIGKTTNSYHLITLLSNIQRHSNFTCVHSINVSLICNSFAKWLKFSDQTVTLLTLAGLLHDIGKLTIAKNIIDSPKKLSDSELALIKTHPEKGYNILKNKSSNQNLQLVALMHHEKIDGTGYPNQLAGNNINKMAKLVTIADVYEAMTAYRPYRGPICTFDVIDKIEYDGYTKYDPEYLSIFLNGIADSHLNCKVELESGDIGKVVMINKHKLSRPIIQLENNNFIDLSKEKTNKIKRVL